MLVDLDLEEKTTRQEKSRTDSATGVLGLGFNPNQHMRERNKKAKSNQQIWCF
jgi:hypothetical protein